MKRNFLILCAIVCTALMLSSCKKDKADTAAIMIVNASPNGGNIDAAVNGSIVASNIAYPTNSGYKEVTTGTNNITVSQTGSTNTFINGTLNMEAGSYYSLYVVDSASKRKATTTRDDLSAPSNGKSKIRVLHLSPNAPAVDIAVTGSSTTNFNNRSFNDIATNASYSAFTEVDAAPITVQIKLAGTSTVLATIPTGVTLTAGKIYTIIIKGFAGGTASQALGVEVITHN